MNRLKIILIGLILVSCTKTAETIEEALNSENYVRWSADQKITPDLFIGKGPEGAYSMWIGFYFIYDQRSEDFKFNVTTFMDKEQSYFDMVNELIETDTIKFSPEMYKLKFDHYEIYARKFRKYLVDNKSSMMSESDEQFGTYSSQFFNDAENSWKETINDLATNNGYNLERLAQLRSEIDRQLNELKDFDSSVNNY